MFKSILSQFSENLTALRDFVDVIAPFLNKRAEEFTQANINSLAPLALALLKVHPDHFAQKGLTEDDIKKIIDGEVMIEMDKIDPNKIKSFSISGPASRSFSNVMIGMGRTLKHEEILYKSSLISLISFAEWFFSQILHEYYYKFSEAAGLDEKVLSYKELKNIGSLKEAENYLIDQKIEGILKSSFDDWLFF